MYNVATVSVDQPQPRWQSSIYGWYLPALFACAWLTANYWIPQAIALTGASHNDLALGFMLLHYGFIASLIFNGGMLIAINPKKHGWLGLTWGIGIAIISLIYPLLDSSTSLGTAFKLAIPNADNPYYTISATTILTGMFLSFSLIFVQHVVNPKAYQSERSMMLAWLALWAIATVYLSPRVSLDLPIVSDHLC